MAKTQAALKLDNAGQYSRQVGWLAGKSGQRKFRLGSDLPKAQVAHYKLGMLWDVVVREHEQRQAQQKGFRPPGESSRAVWTDEALTLAEAVRKHQHTIRVGQPDHIADEGAYVAFLDGLRQRFGHLINIVPADEEAAERGRDEHRGYAEHRARAARVAARMADIPVPAGITGTTLYQAIDAYAEQVQQQNAKESGKVEAGNARRLKAAVNDMDLGEFGYTAMERITTHWAARPEGKRRGGKTTGRPISITTVDNHLSTARRFVRWLDRTDAFDWELPRHGLDALKVNLRRLRTDDELAKRRHGVQVLNVEQLATIYRHASDLERLLVLLGLNAAMAQAEITTLRWDEVEAKTIKRIRRKSGVYAEFALWPETKRALDWWQHLRPAKGDLVMLTDTGRPYIRQRISNAWAGLRDRIAREAGKAPAWWLPFKHLRKTGAQLVRHASDGEIAGVFLSHGQPVASDELADVYTNRPFGRVAEALAEVRAGLAPMLEAAPDAFAAQTIGRGRIVP